MDSEQSGRVKINMFTKAQEIGIPASFVELRHEITHAELPSLVVLRRAVERSMTWLWDDFWRYQDVSSGSFDSDVLAAFDGGSEAFKVEIRQVLQEFQQQQILEHAAANDIHNKPYNTEQTTLKFVRLCQGSRNMLEQLSRVLLEQGFLVPKSSMWASCSSHLR